MSAELPSSQSTLWSNETVEGGSETGIVLLFVSVSTKFRPLSTSAFRPGNDKTALSRALLIAEVYPLHSFILLLVAKQPHAKHLHEHDTLCGSLQCLHYSTDLRVISPTVRL